MVESDIDGVIISRPQAFEDERGRFMEMFRAKHYPTGFAQANHSRSREGVLRGLHYHRHQADLWYVVSGRAQVALADLRTRTHQPHTSAFEMDGVDTTTVFIPPGVAHGFLALTDVELIYWVSHEYDPADEHGVAWDDTTLAIPWLSQSPILSERDARNSELAWDEIPPLS